MSSNCCEDKKFKDKIEKVVDFLRIIGEPNRLRILCLLQEGEECVCNIADYFDLAQNLTSHHLKVLKDFNLVESRKEGTEVIYSVNSKVLSKYCSLLNHYINKKS